MSRSRREFKQKLNYYSGKVVRDIDIAEKARKNEPIKQKKEWICKKRKRKIKFRSRHKDKKVC